MGRGPAWPRLCGWSSRRAADQRFVCAQPRLDSRRVVVQVVACRHGTNQHLAVPPDLTSAFGHANHAGSGRETHTRGHKIEITFTSCCEFFPIHNAPQNRALQQSLEPAKAMEALGVLGQGSFASRREGGRVLPVGGHARDAAGHAQTHVDARDQRVLYRAWGIHAG